MRVKKTMHTTTTAKTNGLGVHFGKVMYGVSVTFFHSFILGFSKYTGDKSLNINSQYGLSNYIFNLKLLHDPGRFIENPA